MRKHLFYLLYFSLFLLAFAFILFIYGKSYLILDYVVEPIESFFYDKSVAIQNFYENIDKLEKLEEENRDLLEKNVQLQLYNSKLLKYKEENEILRKTLNFLDEKKYKYIVANVIAQSVNEYEKVLFIDKGHNDGIEKGDAVIIYDGILIAKVDKVYDSFSRIRLLIDNNSAVAASVLNEDKTIGIVEGVYGLGLRMHLVPQLEKINIGDKVISSGLEEKIPRGLLIGEVDSIDYKQGDLFKTLSIKSLIDFNKLTIVTVLNVDY